MAVVVVDRKVVCSVSVTTVSRLKEKAIRPHWILLDSSTTVEHKTESAFPFGDAGFCRLAEKTYDTSRIGCRIEKHSAEQGLRVGVPARQELLQLRDEAGKLFPHSRSAAAFRMHVPVARSYCVSTSQRDVSPIDQYGQRNTRRVGPPVEGLFSQCSSPSQVTHVASFRPYKYLEPGVEALGSRVMLPPGQGRQSGGRRRAKSFLEKDVDGDRIRDEQWRAPRCPARS